MADADGCWLGGAFAGQQRGGRRRRDDFCAGFFNQRGDRMEVKLNNEKMGMAPSV
jgi:hypothetical protein